MRKFLRKMTALTLVLTMAASLLCAGVWAAEPERADEEKTSAVIEEIMEETREETPDAAAMEETPEEAEEERPEAPAEEKKDAITVHTNELTLEYDDRYDFSVEYPGYTLTIGEQNVNSYQVDEGKKTNSKDTAVLTQIDTSTAVVATGTGTAVVTLSNGSDVVNVTVNVEPAKLTMMFLAGQSNMEGSCSSKTGCKPQDSVLCPEGEVYSTYLPSSDVRGTKISGLENHTTRPTGAERHFVAGSLTDSRDIDYGYDLTYPLNALTVQGKGKTGPDSGLAYEWNRLTGEKVWTINAAVGDSNTSSWMKGGLNYKRANTVYEAALQTANAEVSAGHYTMAHKLLFWLQGEAPYDWQTTDSNSPSVDRYLEHFASMYTQFQDAFGIEKVGLIAVRGHTDEHYDVGDQTMNISRIAQYYMAASAEFSDVFLVSNVNEQWVTDSGVKSYFASAYPSGTLTYPLRENTTLSGLPTKTTKISNGLHYSQVGHNENGITAAKGMLDVISGKTAPPSAKWRDVTGNTVTTLNLSKGESAVAVMEVTPLSASKNVTCQFDSSKISYDPKNGTVTSLTDETSDLTIVSGDKTLATLTIGALKPAKPTLKAPSNTADGVNLSWGKVEDAKDYYVYRKTSGGTYAKLGTTTSTSYVDETAANGVTYIYAVAAHNTAGTGSKSSGKTTVRLTGVKISSLKNSSSKKLTVKWSQNKKASGYQVKYSLKKDFSDSTTKTYSGKDTLSKTLSGLKKGKTYYVRVRVYKTINDTKYYSAWSGTKSLKITK